MTDLMAFLNARLDEDRAAAKAAFGPGIALNWPELPAAVDAFVDRYSPLRATRDVTAKRAILDEHFELEGQRCQRCTAPAVRGSRKAHWPCPTIRALAAVYSDHADFDPEWKPEKGME